MEKCEERLYEKMITALDEISSRLYHMNLLLADIKEKQATPSVLTQATKQDSNVNRNGNKQYR